LGTQRAIAKGEVCAGTAFADLQRLVRSFDGQLPAQGNFPLPTVKPVANGAPHPLETPDSSRPSGRSSVVEHDLAKVGVEGSNPFARSSFSMKLNT
jgi:hypothetical protein